MSIRKLNALKYKGAEKLDLTNEGNQIFYRLFNPYRRIFGTVTERDFWGKYMYKNIACNVTVETKKIKNICTDRVPVGLFYNAELKCHIEPKYMPIFGTKNPKHRNIQFYRKMVPKKLL